MKQEKVSEGKGLSPALRWFLNLAFLTLWAAGIGFVPLYFTAVNFGREMLFSYLENPLILLLNLLPGLLLALLLFAITNRMWPAIFGSGVVIIGISVIHYFKMLTRSEPLLAADVKYITEAADISSRYTLTVSPVMILSALVVVLAAVFAFFLLKARFHRAAPRLILLAAVLMLGAGLYLGLYRSEDVYAATENVDIVFSNHRTMNKWNEKDQYCGRGFWYPFLYSTTDLGPHKPENYSASTAEALLSGYESADLSAEQKISVISVMLEAYADFSALDELEFAADPYRFFHALEAESISGWLDTNIFTGGTIDTERCYMTGSTELYEYRGAAQSFVRWFSSQGYKTEFCHPGYAWFYNRRNVSEYLGFDRSYFGDKGEPLFAGDNITMSDADFFPFLVDLFHEAAADGTPYFNMSVTYQNHGPYADGYLYEPEREYVRRSALSTESYNILNNYFSGIAQTDAALETLVDTLRHDDAPVVLVLFGDHKPWLGDGNSVYTELGIDLSRETEESFYAYSRTPYVIWANEAAKKALGRDFSGDGGDFSPCYLMMRLFDACGWEGSAYLNAQRDVFAAADIVSPRLSRYRSGGAFYKEFEALPPQAREKVGELLILSYYQANHAIRRIEWTKKN